MVYDIRNSDRQPFGLLDRDWTDVAPATGRQTPQPSSAPRPSRRTHRMTAVGATTTASAAFHCHPARPARTRRPPSTRRRLRLRRLQRLLRYKAGGTNDDRILWGNPSNLDKPTSPASFGTAFSYRNMNPKYTARWSATSTATAATTCSGTKPARTRPSCGGAAHARVFGLAARRRRGPVAPASRRLPATSTATARPTWSGT